MVRKENEKIVVFTCRTCKCLYSKKPGFSFLRRLDPMVASEFLGFLELEMRVERIEEDSSANPRRSRRHCEACRKSLKDINKGVPFPIRSRQKPRGWYPE